MDSELTSRCPFTNLAGFAKAPWVGKCFRELIRGEVSLPDSLEEGRALPQFAAVELMGGLRMPTGKPSF